MKTVMLVTAFLVLISASVFCQSLENIGQQTVASINVSISADKNTLLQLDFGGATKGSTSTVSINAQYVAFELTNLKVLTGAQFISNWASGNKNNSAGIIITGNYKINKVRLEASIYAGLGVTKSDVSVARTKLMAGVEVLEDFEINAGLSVNSWQGIKITPEVKLNLLF